MTVSRDFLLLLFNEYVSPQLQSIPLGPFRILLRKFAEIFASQGAPLVSMTPAAKRHRQQILPPVSLVMLIPRRCQICHRCQIMGTISCCRHLKGTVSRDFCFWFFTWISFPPAPEYSIKTISNFFENSRRYSQFKVHHQWQTMGAIIKLLTS